MKRILLALLFLFSIELLVSQSQPLNREILLSSDWCPKYGSWGYWLTFNQDGTYRIHFSGEGGGQFVEGTYEVINNSAILKKEAEFIAGSSIPDEVLEDETIWNLELDTSSLFFNYKLVSRSGYAFWMRNSTVPDGSKRTVSGTEIIIERKDNCKLLYDSKVRKGPGLDFAFSDFYFEFSGENLNYLPQNHWVETIGRTLEPVSIGDWNDYWYYCKLKLDWYDSGPSYGWIYGALLDK